MIWFIVRRLLGLAFTLWCVFTVSFLLMRAVPGGPYSGERNLPPEIEENFKQQYRLNLPLAQQYGYALTDILSGNFGLSMRLYDFSVNQVITQGLPVSAALGVFALSFAVTLGLTAGIVSALYRGTFADWALMSLATIGIALPSFVIAGLSIILFVFLIPIFPAAGWGTFRQLVLPAICLGSVFAAEIARIARTGMLDALSQDYVRTARAKGLSHLAVALRHALPGAMMPVVSFLGPAVAGILTGSVVIERIFAIPGLGWHFVQASLTRDYTLAMGLVLLYTLLLYTMNFLVDLSYGILDPRVGVDVTATPNEAACDFAQPAKGVSLGRDAWRRLRRNRAAMASLVTLVVIVLLAFFTPLLPLSPPDKHQTSLQYEPPKLSPLFGKNFTLDMHAVQASRAKIAEGRRELIELEQRAGEIRRAAKSDSNLALESAERNVRNKHNDLSNILQRPYRDAGFPDLRFISRWMVRTRSDVFGEWSLGTIAGRDEFGRDVLSRVFWGARISIIVGIVATLVSLSIGVTYGALAGYIGGWVDDIMMRIVDILYSIPFIFVVIFIITILSEDQVKARLEYWGIDRITIFYLVVGAIYWLTMARVVRGQVISLRNEPFVEGARAVGASQSRIIVRHILPNLMSVVIVYLTLTIPRVMLFEAFLSFLGLGVEPPNVSWGLLANEGIKVITPVKIYWWLIVFPSAALGTTLYALNFLGDGLRDALDPKLAMRR